MEITENRVYTAWIRSLAWLNSRPIVRDERNEKVKMGYGLRVKVNSPAILDNYPAWNFASSKTRLLAYQFHPGKQVLAGFDYTYSERIGIQVYYIIAALNDPRSRRAAFTVWDPEYDTGEKALPCLVSGAFYVDGELHLEVFYRSWDVAGALPSNYVFLNSLLTYVAKELVLPPGSISVTAACPHIRGDDFDNVDELLRNHKS
jgi:thymidylate synthase